MSISCPHLFKDVHQALDCGEALFSEAPLHLTLSSIPPSNGFQLGGVYEQRTHYVSSPYSSGAQTDGTPAYKSLTDGKVAFVISTNASWYATGSFAWLPPLHYRDDTRQNGEACHLLGHLCTRSVFGVEFFITHRDIKTLYFYGLGISASNTQFAFKENETYGGASARMPIADWLTLEGQVENRKPSAAFSNASLALKSISEAIAPGFSAQPDFMHYSIGLRTHAQRISERATNPPAVPVPGIPTPPLMKHKLIFNLDNNFEQNWFVDQDAGHYSFHEMRFNGTETVKLHAVIQRFVSPESTKGRLKILRHFCQGLKVTDECDFGEFDVRPLLVLSAAPGANAVPFYFQPTLGGSDIESMLSLRGFENYRFRAPDVIMVQAEYGIPVVDPIGAVLFYDAGTVGLSAHDLSFAHARQDAGTGITLRLQNSVVAQIYVALGAGHGAHFGYNFTKFF